MPTLSAHDHINAAMDNAALAVEMTGPGSNPDAAATVQALLALTHAVLAVANRTSGAHCENCCVL